MGRYSLTQRPLAKDRQKSPLKDPFAKTKGTRWVVRELSSSTDLDLRKVSNCSFMGTFDQAVNSHNMT
ncbi:hypothetical protein ACFX11_030839 [Malus domestica]